MKYRNKKTNKIYRHLAIGEDLTPGRENTLVIIYCPDDEEHTVFVCEQERFDEDHEYFS
jgi:hypothetical protein